MGTASLASTPVITSYSLFRAGTFEYLPFKTPYKMVMGLEPSSERQWIEMDMFYEEEMAIRSSILATRKDAVIARLPSEEVRAAEEELLEMLVDYLPTRFPGRQAPVRYRGIMSNIPRLLCFLC